MGRGGVVYAKEACSVRERVEFVCVFWERD